MENSEFDQAVWNVITNRIIYLEKEGLVTRTFRRLDPARQLEILDAILYEAAENGPAKISISAVAHRCAAAVGSMYQYFPDRQSMIDFAEDLSIHYLTDMILEYRPYMLQMPTIDALMTYLTSGVEMSRTQQGFLLFFGRAAYQGDPQLSERVIEPIASAMFDTVNLILQQAKVRGEIREDLDIEAAAHIINAMLIAVGDSILFPYLNKYLRVYDSNTSHSQILQALPDLIHKAIAK